MRLYYCLLSMPNKISFFEENFFLRKENRFRIFREIFLNLKSILIVIDLFENQQMSSIDRQMFS